MKNLFQSIPSNFPKEITEVLASSGNVRVEKILSSGQTSPEDFWYDQTEHEFVCVLQGQTILEFDDGETSFRKVEMKPGDWILIEPHQKHLVIYTSKSEVTIWLAVFF